MDALWFQILEVIHGIRHFLDAVFSPLNELGPMAAIFLIAFLTVIITKVLTKTFKTKRYLELKEEFEYWYNIRSTALKADGDPEEGKQLAKNIDSAKLNQVYYNLFFEGLMISLLTKYIPILLMLAYVNEAYKPRNLVELFGQKYIFTIMESNGEAVHVGAAFWFIISVVMIYLGWFLIGRLRENFLS